MILLQKIKNKKLLIKFEIGNTLIKKYQLLHMCLISYLKHYGNIFKLQNKDEIILFLWQARIIKIIIFMLSEIK